MHRYELTDNSVVVIVGSGAGGGTLANELAQKGIDVVLLEAGKQQSPVTFINDEWASFAQLAWLDKRTTSGTWRIAKDFPNLPTWICKTVGGTTAHWAGASLRFQAHEFQAHPTIKMLALAFLFVIGMVLVADGFGHHVPKGYIYFAMAFSVGVELLNIRLRKRRIEPVDLREHYSRDKQL